MAYLMHIGFDNSSRLWKDVYYFEYKGVRYKLIQNNIRKYCDVLLTIIPNNNDKKRKDFAYINASEFLCALSWKNDSHIKVRNLGGAGIHNNFKLKSAKCRAFDIPEITRGIYRVGYNINRIPEIETKEQRDALMLFREALSTNNYYLSFLFYYQILEIGENDPIGWINKALRRNRREIRLSNHDLARLPLRGKQIGNYLYDDCRNAIAHIHKRPKGKIKIKLDTPQDNIRINHSTKVIKEFARSYIENKLNLHKEMWLVRKKGRGFPVYISKDSNRNNFYVLAYKDPNISFAQFKKKKWH